MFGRDMITLPRAELPNFRRRLGVVFQDFRLVEHLSAFDNVALPLRLAGTDESRVQKAVGDMLDWVNLSHRSHARPETMSGGEQQRVAIARAVIARLLARLRLSRRAVEKATSEHPWELVTGCRVPTRIASVVNPAGVEAALEASPPPGAHQCALS